MNLIKIMMLLFVNCSALRIINKPLMTYEIINKSKSYLHP